jgi:fido (protein-threonine AMPylation protein)
MGGLPSPAEAQDIWTPIWYQEAHNSTALEGNTLVLREVEVLLQTGQVVGQKELKDYLEVKGYAAAAEWVYGHAIGPDQRGSGRLLTIQEVREVHHRAMGLVWEVAPHPQATPDESPGNWRRHNIQAFPGGMRPPEFTEVPALMHDWVAGVNRIHDDSAPVAEAVAARHAAFERVHPFLDGNGRAGRLLMNLMLVRLGYPPAVIRTRGRARYLRALAAADDGDAAPLGELVARAVLDSLYRFAIPAVAGPSRLVPLAALETRDLSVQALRAAAERGRLQAIKGDDGQWRSSRRWVEEYATRRYQRPAREPAAAG